MFFSRFVFTISYRPGSQNVKADALCMTQRSVHGSYLHTPGLVAPVVWELDADIEQALRAEPAPLQCPAGRLYLLSAVQDRLIYWADTSPSSGHPGIGRTVRCLSGKYRWPTLAKDVGTCWEVSYNPTRSTTAMVAPVDRFSHRSPPHRVTP